MNSVLLLLGCVGVGLASSDGAALVIRKPERPALLKPATKRADDVTSFTLSPAQAHGQELPSTDRLLWNFGAPNISFSNDLIVGASMAVQRKEMTLTPNGAEEEYGEVPSRSSRQTGRSSHGIPSFSASDNFPQHSTQRRGEDGPRHNYSDDHRQEQSSDRGSSPESQSGYPYEEEGKDNEPEPTPMPDYPPPSRYAAPSPSSPHSAVPAPAPRYPNSARSHQYPLSSFPSPSPSSQYQSRPVPSSQFAPSPSLFASAPAPAPSHGYAHRPPPSTPHNTHHSYPPTETAKSYPHSQPQPAPTKSEWISYPSPSPAASHVNYPAPSQQYKVPSPSHPRPSTSPSPYGGGEERKIHTGRPEPSAQHWGDISAPYAPQPSSPPPPPPPRHDYAEPEPSHPAPSSPWHLRPPSKLYESKLKYTPNKNLAEWQPMGQPPAYGKPIAPLQTPSSQSYRPAYSTDQNTYKSNHGHVQPQTDEMFKLATYGNGKHWGPVSVKGSEPRGSFAGSHRPYSAASPLLNFQLDPPDKNSDKCFWKYADTVVGNSQPFHRQTMDLSSGSAVTVSDCRKLCADTMGLAGRYKCVSFLFDRVNYVCDLFAHSGRVHPARLLAFPTRDYFEFTPAACPEFAFSTDVVRPTDAPLTTYAAPPSPAPPTTRTTVASTDKGSRACKSGEELKYVALKGYAGRTEDRLPGATSTGAIAKCFRLCDRHPACRAVQHSGKSGRCQLLRSAETPNLLKLDGTDSAENIVYRGVCANDQWQRLCGQRKVVFDMTLNAILVGFADVATDSNSLEECLGKCVSRNAENQLDPTFEGCNSVIYYEDTDENLNCILNTETHLTKPDLFVDDSGDSANYLSFRCVASSGRTPPPTSPFQSSSAAVRKFFSLQRRKSIVLGRKKVVPERPVGVALSSGTAGSPMGAWSEWTTCNPNHRSARRECNATKLRRCPMQIEWCDKSKQYQKLSL